MNSKLVLDLDKEVIEKAKDYAKTHKVSLSKLFENYLNSITKKERNRREVSPFVESLTGVIPDEPETDYKAEYYAYLERKHS